MAATVMIRCRLSSRFLRSRCRYSTGPFLVLTPQVPPDTPETNPVMRVNEYLNFKEITPFNCLSAVSKYKIDYEIEMRKLDEKLGDPAVEKTFKSVVEPFERLGFPLRTAFKATACLGLLEPDKFRPMYNVVAEKYDLLDTWDNSQFYKSLQELKANASGLTAAEEHLVDRLLLAGQMAGAGLSEERKLSLKETASSLHVLQTNYTRRVTHSKLAFQHEIEDFSLINEMPRHLAYLLAADKTNPSKGPWFVTLDERVYEPFMEHCPNRTMRWNVWSAYNALASQAGEHLILSNNTDILSIRVALNNLARIADFPNYAVMSTANKMAGTVETVLDLIETLKNNYYDKCAKEIEELQEYAVNEGFQSSIEMWDLPYWRRRHHDHLYKLKEVETYLQYEKVLEGLLGFCRDLFGIRFQEIEASSAWHSSVKMYEVYDLVDGKLLGTFYIDPYRRKGKSVNQYMNLRERSESEESTPAVVISHDVYPPFRDQSAVMDYASVEILFHHLGACLQDVMSNAAFAETHGTLEMEQDASRAVPHLMGMFLRTPSVLRQISSHIDTGEPFPDDMIDALIKSNSQLQAFDLMRELYFSAFEIEMFINNQHYHGMMTSIWEDFNPIPISVDDYHMCSSDIFTPSFTTMKYSNIWSKMMAADFFKEFDDVGLENLDKMAMVGKRFREKYIGQMGCVSAAEAFRQFKGRDPSVQALISYHDKMKE